MTHTHNHHHHSHGHGSGSSSTRLALTLLLVVTYMVAELVGGLLTNSLALIADAGHMFSDAAALGLALFALWFARRPATPQHTFGYHRTEILAALANGATLVAISIYILVEAIQRIGSPPEVRGGWMMAVAAGGLLINLAGLYLLHGARSDNLNVRGAWLHVMSDMLGSVQALLAGVLIWQFGWNWADPVASILIAMLVAYSSWALLRESVAVLMQRAPSHIDVESVRASIQGVEGVIGMCDLHVWTLTSGKESMSAHVVVAQGANGFHMLERVRQHVHERFGIDHVTIQIEPEGFEEPATEF